jgi:hypothetical protein
MDRFPSGASIKADADDELDNGEPRPTAIQKIGRLCGSFGINQQHISTNFDMVARLVACQLAPASLGGLEQRVGVGAARPLPVDRREAGHGVIVPGSRRCAIGR